MLKNKLNTYKLKHRSIKENSNTKAYKNIIFNILRFIMIIISIMLFLIGLVALSGTLLDATFFVSILGKYITDVKVLEKISDILMTINIVICLFTFLPIFLLLFINYLLRLNNKKRKQIYLLSQMLGEIITDLEEVVDEDRNKDEILSEKNLLKE